MPQKLQKRCTMLASDLFNVISGHPASFSDDGLVGECACGWGVTERDEDGHDAFVQHDHHLSRVILERIEADGV